MIKKEEEQTIIKDGIRNIALLIADNSYKGHYTIEKYSKSQYRFGFGITESNNTPIMFTANSVKEAMYLAIDFELTKEIKTTKGCDIVPRSELISQDTHQKSNKSESMTVIAASDDKYKELIKEIDAFKHEQKYITNVINRFREQWKDDTVMKTFGENVEVWEKKNKLSLFIAFLLEYIEKQTHQIEMASDDDIIPFKKFEEKKEKSLLAGAKVLATFHTGSVFEPVWNEMRDTVIDGNWHIYPEAESIVIKYSDHHLTMVAARQKRQAYFSFATDEKYHDARGGKDYLFEWKRSGKGNKFRFTTKLEKHKVVDPGVKVDTINRHPVYKIIRDEFISLFCDRKYHTYSEAITLFKKYDNYKKYKQESFYPLIRAYLEHVHNFYEMTKVHKNGVQNFKFGSKYDLTGTLMTAENDIKCTRCGQIIDCGTQHMQVDNMAYHLGCYDILNNKK